MPIQKKEVKANQHESYRQFTIIAILLPFVGIILSIIYLTKEKVLDKKLGTHLLLLSIISNCIWLFLFGTFVLHPLTTTSTPVVTTTISKDNANKASSTTAPTVAHVGSTIKLGGDNGIAVTLQQVIDPATPDNQYMKPDSGKRLVAIKLQIKNNSSGSYSDDVYLNVVTLIGTDNQNATFTIYPVSECTNFSSGSYTLSTNSSVTGCIVFQMPNSVSTARVQFKPNSTDYNSDTGEWLVP